MTQTIRQAIQTFLIDSEGTDVTAKEIYNYLHSNGNDIINHPIYGDETLGFNSVRNTLHSLYKENWFSSDERDIETGPYGEYVVYRNIYPNRIDHDSDSKEITNNEFQNYLDRQKNYVSDSMVCDKKTCCGGNCHKEDEEFDDDVDKILDDTLDDDIDEIDELPPLYILVLRVIKDFTEEDKEFSAYDVTKKIRSFVKDNNFLEDIYHDDVKQIVHELFNEGLFYGNYSSSYSKNYKGQGFILYHP